MIKRYLLLVVGLQALSAFALDVKGLRTTTVNGSEALTNEDAAWNIWDND